MTTTTPETSQCPHARVEHLGTDFPAEFFRCEMCGTVLVVQGRRVWRVRRSVFHA